MKIKVTEERWCCQPQDLKPVEGCGTMDRIPMLMFCVHCGHRHEYHSFVDPAGSRDWNYKKLDEVSP